MEEVIPTKIKKAQHLAQIEPMDLGIPGLSSTAVLQPLFEPYNEFQKDIKTNIVKLFCSW